MARKTLTLTKPEAVPEPAPDVLVEAMTRVKLRNAEYFQQFHDPVRLIKQMIYVNLCGADGCVVDQLTRTADLITGDNVAERIIATRQAYLAEADNWKLKLVNLQSETGEKP